MKKLTLLTAATALFATSHFASASCNYAYSNGGINVKSRCSSSIGDAQFGMETGSLFSSKYRNGFIARDTIITRNGHDFSLRLTGSDDPEMGFCKIHLVALTPEGNDDRTLYEAYEALGVAGKTHCQLSMNFDLWGFGDDADRYQINYAPLFAKISIAAEGWEDVARDDSHPDYFDILQSPSNSGDDDEGDAPSDDMPIDEEPPVDAEPPINAEPPEDDEPANPDDDTASYEEQIQAIVASAEAAVADLDARDLDETQYNAELAHVRSRHMTEAHTAFGMASAHTDIDRELAEALLEEALATIEDITAFES